jgi:hypothetical protein
MITRKISNAVRNLTAFLTLVANRREFSVSEKQSSRGLMLRNMRVLLLPPRQFCSRCVSFELRYGMCCSYTHTATIIITINFTTSQSLSSIPSLVQSSFIESPNCPLKVEFLVYKPYLTYRQYYQHKSNSLCQLKQ